MADEIVAKYRVDVSGASAALDQLAAKTQKTGQTLDDSFNKGSDGVKRLQAELAKQPKTLADLELRLVKLKELLRDDTKIGTEGFKQVTKAINDTNAAIKQANASLAETPKQTNMVVDGFKKLGAAMLAAFAVDKIISFTKEAITLAAKAEGVERAFAKIGSPELLQGLRNATNGTVTDLVLMQSAVKASNFKIPLDQLGSLLKYAQMQARATGQDVDYLVESLITGIGRKSVLVLDNLQISAVELREKLGDVSLETATVGQVAEAVGTIASASFAKMGAQALTTADEIAQMETAWTNFKTNLGSGIIKIAAPIAKAAGIISQDAQRVAEFTLSTSEMTLRELQKTIELYEQAYKASTGLFKKEDPTGLNLQADLARELLAIAKEEYNLRVKMMGGGNEEEAPKPSEIDVSIQAKINKQLEEEAKLRASQIKNVFYYTEAIQKLDEKIKAEGTAVADILPLIRERAEMQEKLTALTKEESFGIDLLNSQMAELQKQLNSATVGGGVFWQILSKLDAKIKELNQAQAMKKLAEALIPDEEPESQALMNKITAELDAENKMLDGKKEAHEEFNEWQKGELENWVQTQLDANKETTKATELTEEEKRQIWEAAANTTIQLIGMVSQSIQEGYQRDLQNLDERLNQGLISEQEYDKEKRELLSKQNDAAKQAAIFQAIINTALAVTSALTAGPIVGPILAALAGILGAAQIAFITSQQPPQFAKGVVDLQGEGTATSDSIHAKLSKGESVITAKETSKHRGLLEAMNKGLAEKYILSNYVKPALDSAMLSGFADMGKSAEVNGLTANLKDHNIIAAMDRHRAADVAGFKMLAAKLDRRQPKRGGYA